MVETSTAGISAILKKILAALTAKKKTKKYLLVSVISISIHKNTVSSVRVITNYCCASEVEFTITVD
ncbi:hypothetical protein KQX54_014200 [Cotesia glomerata]|uniref:Uncharacterized protein n=1 Tax=Cotesia glomerata TaxID=32391 RepID=A0AAV7ILA6_COTGL|nr:hypothetical protein KQX54_014200 [Cotesia glomerata]